MAVAAPSPVRARRGRLGVAIAVVLTIAAGFAVAGGALVLGLAFAHLVWRNDARLKYRFAMLGGIFTLVWGVLLFTAASGVFDSVHSSQGTPTTVTAPR